jgi:hypothetical protein
MESNSIGIEPFERRSAGTHPDCRSWISIARSL